MNLKPKSKNTTPKKIKVLTLERLQPFTNKKYESETSQNQPWGPEI